MQQKSYRDSKEHETYLNHGHTCKPNLSFNFYLIKKSVIFIFRTMLPDLWLWSEIQLRGTDV